jgi:glycosyltransferase involved in cell wall biosynthesis
MLRQTVTRENPMNPSIELSVIIPVTEERYDDVTYLFHEYKRGISETGMSYEIIYVLDGAFPGIREALQDLREQGEKLMIIQLAKHFGAAAALNVGFEHSKGDIILTLPAYQQTEVDEIPRLVAALKEYDMVFARRWPRADSFFNRTQARLFNWLLRHVSDLPIHDAGSNVKAFRRQVINEVHIYGDQHPFLPVLAHQRGFKVHELKVAQAKTDVFRRVYSPGTYIRHLLDVLAIFFLVKFTKKPLRFFGLLGTAGFSVGFLITLYIVGERLFGGVALANRPALLLSSLLMILGIQILAIGLIGEIIIFTHAKELKEYTIAQIIN